MINVIVQTIIFKFSVNNISLLNSSARNSTNEDGEPGIPLYTSVEVGRPVRPILTLKKDIKLTSGD